MESQKPLNSYRKQLATIFSVPRDTKQMEELLDDFLSPQEICHLVERWYISELLLQGISQRDIKQRLGVSISKTTRVSRTLQYGRGGLRKVWQEMNQLTNRPTSRK